MIHSPLYDATMVAKPMNHGIAANIRYHRLAWLAVNKQAIVKPAAMLLMPRALTARIRGLLPLQIDQRMKLGCDWPRRVASATLRAGAKADGCVVCCKAWRTRTRSR
jgi:hypothetical protein